MRTWTLIPLVVLGGVLALVTTACSNGTSTSSTLAEPAQEAVALGRLLFFDAGLSEPAGQSCASCHDPGRAFTDPRPGFTSEGAVAGLFGARNTPTAAYAAFTPAFAYDAEAGTYQGGLFMDGRAAGLEDQAQGPPLNPIEMHNPDRRAYVGKVAAAPYAPRIRRLLGEEIFVSEDTAFAAISRLIAAFERSPELSPFTSKYDAYLKGATALTAQERLGLALFEGRAGCSACHPSQPDGARRPPLFTDFTYDNLGLPKNPGNRFYDMDATHNPAGSAFVDLGLAGNAQVIQEGRAAESRGKFKVPTLRNLGRTAPYGHNGVFATLKDVVAFYNRRDLDPLRFGPPEVAENVNRRELGNLGLSEDEEDALVAFLNTLNDGYR